MSVVVDGVVVVMAPPDDYVVDMDNPQRHYVLANYIAAGIGMTFAFLFMAQRIYVKVFLMSSFGIDDLCGFGAWVFTVAMHGLLINGFAEGIYGVHAWEIPIDKFGRYVLMANYVQALIYVFPTLLSKLCLLIFYIKLQNRRLWYQLAVWGTIFVTVGSNLGILFSVAFACKPISMAYDITVTEGTCIDRAAVFKATAAFGIITDILIFMIPIPMVITLQLSLRKKLGLVFMFTIGSATVVTSVVRLVLLMKNLSKQDLTWIGGPIFFWISIEANLLVICSCLPTLKAFFQSLSPKLIGSGSHDRAKYHTNSAGLGSSYGRGGGGTLTVSSTRHKPNSDYYHGLEEDEEGLRGYRMETLVEGGMRRGPAMAPSSKELGAGAPGDSDSRGTGGSRDSGDKDRDDDSAKAIIRTQTVQVSYEDRQI